MGRQSIQQLLGVAGLGLSVAACQIWPPMFNRDSGPRTSSSAPPTAPKTPAASPHSPQTPVTKLSPAAIAPDPNYQTALNKAEGAVELAKTAQTPQDWQLIAAQWQRAIALLKALPKTSPQYKSSQGLLADYQTQLAQAQRYAKTGGQLPQAQPAKSANGAPLIAVGSSLSTEGGAQEGSANLSAINQKQLDFFSQKQRFAASLAELDKDAFVTTDSYTYQTRGLEGNRALSFAIAQQNGLPSYVALVQLKKDDKGKVNGSLSGICVSQNPSKTAPAQPLFKDEQIQCPAATTRV